MSFRPSWTFLHTRLHQILRTRQLLPKHHRVLVAVSGGQDSLCLAKLLLDLRPKWEWQLAIVHCDHRWHLDEGIAAHVQQLAESWSIPFYLQTSPQVTPSEAAARQWRYLALVDIASSQGYQEVVTGHTKSDRAETLLYNLMRGAAADGLTSLVWSRPLATGIQLVRPLLEVTRSETFQFCCEQQLPIWDDPYNQDLKYARNRIRQELIPYLAKNFNPKVEKALAQTAELLRADVEYLENAAAQLLQEAKESVNMDEPDRPPRLNRLVLQQAPLSLQRRVIRQFLEDVQPTAPSFEQIEAITALISAPNRSRTSSFSKAVTVEVQGNWIVFVVSC
jgi:tRNA(Ile)-lysidine synthase